QRIQASLRRAGAGVVRAADALQERGDAARRADLADELDRADVDAELQRRGGDQRLERAGAQARLDPPAPLLREAAVVRGHDVVAQALAELVREPLRHPPRVDKYEGGLMVRDVLGDAIDDVGHLLRRRDRFELTLGQLDGDVERALVTDVDDLRQRTLADEQPPDPLDGTLRRREADARRPPVAERLEPFQREREVRAALVAGDGVDLVDDDGLGRAPRLA